jgi:tetraacyldisaccharide 4'-kinase
MRSPSQGLLTLGYSRLPWLLPLYPLGWVFRGIVALRVRCFQWGIFRQYQSPCPVIVIGNISIGGTGKTPVVMWLAQWLIQHKWRVGIVSKGYGGDAQGPVLVHRNDTPDSVGDEALMMAQHLSCPVVVAKKRASGIIFLREHHSVDIVLLDDGLQHYAVARDYEIVLIDGQRGLGNRQCLPAGPLREPPSRLQSVDWIVTQGPQPFPGTRHHFQLLNTQATALGATGERRPLSSFVGKRVHAIAGIGHPERFFKALEAKGLAIVGHAFKDHHEYQLKDFTGFENEIILMTAKDAIKCAALDLESAWVVDALPQGLEDFGCELLQRLEKEHPNGCKAT